MGIFDPGQCVAGVSETANAWGNESNIRVSGRQESCGRTQFKSVRLWPKAWSGARFQDRKSRTNNFRIYRCRMPAALSLIGKCLDFSRIEQGASNTSLEADGSRLRWFSNGQAQWSAVCGGEGGAIGNIQHPNIFNIPNLELEVERTRRFNRRW